MAFYTYDIMYKVYAPDLTARANLTVYGEWKQVAFKMGQPVRIVNVSAVYQMRDDFAGSPSGAKTVPILPMWSFEAYWGNGNENSLFSAEILNKNARGGFFGYAPPPPEKTFLMNFQSLHLSSELPSFSPPCLYAGSLLMQAAFVNLGASFTLVELYLGRFIVTVTVEI